MGYRKQRFKDGVIIETIDTRVLSEVQDEKREEVRKCLGEYLSMTDWEVVRAADPTSGEAVKASTITNRQAARDLAVTLEAEIDAATTLDDLERFTGNICDLMENQ